MSAIDERGHQENLLGPDRAPQVVGRRLVSATHRGRCLRPNSAQLRPELKQLRSGDILGVPSFLSLHDAGSDGVGIEREGIVLCDTDAVRVARDVTMLGEPMKCLTGKVLLRHLALERD